MWHRHSCLCWISACLEHRQECLCHINSYVTTNVGFAAAISVLKPLNARTVY